MKQTEQLLLQYFGLACRHPQSDELRVGNELLNSRKQRANYLAATPFFL